MQPFLAPLLDPPCRVSWQTACHAIPNLVASPAVYCLPARTCGAAAQQGHQEHHHLWVAVINQAPCWQTVRQLSGTVEGPHLGGLQGGRACMGRACPKPLCCTELLLMLCPQAGLHAVTHLIATLQRQFFFQLQVAVLLTFKWHMKYASVEARR